ncbi:MAG TPA: MOSC domain-containing protein [Thermoanaerobaculia bacterium]|nr:MOSC domain-containing protein [Thermoanaerobaculia bacterium]
MGEIVAIWIKRFKHGPMDPVTEAVAVEGRGLVDNANQRGKRQVTIIDESRWAEAQEEVGVPDLDPRTRRANLMLRGIDLERTNGRLLRLGDVTVRIYGETRPCHQMEEAQPGLRAALSPRWRGGAFGEIVTGGTIRVGDAAEWLPPIQKELI